MKIINRLSIVLSLILFISCGIPQEEFDKVLAENEKLKKEIEELKFGPDKLLTKANLLITDKDFESAKKEIQLLIEKHPTSNQALKAKELLPIIEKGILDKKENEERKQKEKEKVEKERLANATKKLKSNYDDIKGITWYYDKGTPKYNNYNSFHLYMGKNNNGSPWLRLKIQYASSDWLFIESYVVKTDNGSHTISTSRGEVERDNGSGGIWEWYDVSLTDELYYVVKDIINSKNVKIRHNGSQYYKDRVISEKEKQGLKNVLDAYSAMSGKYVFY